MRTGPVSPRLLLLGAMMAAVAQDARPAVPGLVVIEADSTPVVFRPHHALGAGLDGSGRGETDRILTLWNVDHMRALGLKPLTYRLRTELGIEAWHWNPRGTWSDPARRQGYWLSSDEPATPIQVSYGYSLPRRGDTMDNANNAGYSRLDDGDTTSFWKSNPYLDIAYTHEPAARPQWTIVEFGDPTGIDAARIEWALPYAVRYQVQYWVGVDEYDRRGRWVTFPGGAVTAGQGGESDLRLAPAPIATRFVRLLLETSSASAAAGSTDPRDAMGFAIRELALGVRKPDGGLADAIRHAPSAGGQTLMHVSSTDPWHREADRDPDTEQPGLDRVYASGLTNGMPMMVPVGVLYDTPQNAAAQVRYLRRRGYPLERVELGEEPDGQNIDARDYGALYLQTADAIHKVAPDLTLGGPSLQNGEADTWLDPDPDHSWTRHFIRYLKARGRLADLGFFSFERYPFDDLCGDLHAKMLMQTRMMSALFDRLRADEVPTTIPWVITEYGFSAYSGRPMVELPSALLMADIVGQFLSLGGEGAYLFGYPPNEPINQHLACAGYGNMTPFLADAQGQAGAPLPEYQAARLLTAAWTDGTDRPHALHKARVEVPLAAEGEVTAYPVRRPDQSWSVMLVNRDPRRAFALRLRFREAGGMATPKMLNGLQYSAANYEWLADGRRGHPGRNLPPSRLHGLNGRKPVLLPPYSLTVMRLNAPPRQPRSRS